MYNSKKKIFFTQLDNNTIFYLEIFILFAIALILLSITINCIYKKSPKSHKDVYYGTLIEQVRAIFLTSKKKNIKMKKRLKLIAFFYFNFCINIYMFDCR